MPDLSAEHRLFSIRTRFWLLGLALLLFFVWLLSNVLMPFVLGMAIAYLLDPICDRLERGGMPRWLGTTLILFVVVMVGVIAMLVLVPLMVRQIQGLVTAMPAYLEALSAFVQPLILQLRDHLSAEDYAQIQAAFRNYMGSIVSWTGAVLGGIWQGGLAIIDVLSLLVVTPVVAFYMLRDWDRMIGVIDGNVPRPQRATVRMLGREVDETLARFVRGQLTVCLLFGTFYAISLSIVGLNFALLIGLMTAVLSIIPYVGTLVGFVTSVGIAFFQFDDWTMWALVAGIFILGQILEGNFITPKLVGDSVGLHPVWIMFALFAGGALFGFTGVMLGVPIAAIIGVLVRFAIRRYRGSSLYTGDERSVPPPPPPPPALADDAAPARAPDRPTA